jgi:hypothetical protein
MVMMMTLFIVTITIIIVITVMIVMAIMIITIEAKNFGRTAKAVRGRVVRGQVSKGWWPLSVGDGKPGAANANAPNRPIQSTLWRFLQSD